MGTKRAIYRLLAPISLMYICDGFCAVPFSDYGMIQNVQTYSSNPFYDKNAAYNQRMPTPVYATGPNVESNDCQTIVSTVVAQTCATMNNCRNAQLSDIRPTVILSLSRIPGGNYATSCAGYLDTIFNQYRSNNQGGVKIGGSPVPFPVATTPNPTVAPPTTTITFGSGAQPAPEWKTEMAERSAEIQELQSSMYNDPKLAMANFPKTIDDLSFTERINIRAMGYEPFKDSKAYHGIDLESKTDYLTRKAEEAATTRKYCEEKYGTTIAELRREIETLNNCIAQKKSFKSCTNKSVGKFTSDGNWLTNVCATLGNGIVGDWCEKLTIKKKTGGGNG